MRNLYRESIVMEKWVLLICCSGWCYLDSFLFWFLGGLVGWLL